MTFPYPINVNVPNAGNPPRNDQQPMKVNFANINGFLGVDHVDPGTADGAGFHEKITYNDQYLPGVQTDPESVGFTANAANLGGNATNRASPIVQQFFRNQHGTFGVMLVKAFAAYNVPAPTGILNAFNVASVTRTSAGLYAVVLATGAVIGTSFAILISSTRNPANSFVVYNYVITGVGTFDIRFRNLQNNVDADPDQFSFAVLQT